MTLDELAEEVRQLIEQIKRLLGEEVPSAS